MIGTAHERARAQAVAEVLEFLAKRKLELADLLEFGGQDLGFRDPKRAKKARQVEKAWARMAWLGMTFADLESAP
jgi:hypothetical protein